MGVCANVGKWDEMELIRGVNSGKENKWYV